MMFYFIIHGGSYTGGGWTNMVQGGKRIQGRGSGVEGVDLDANSANWRELLNDKGGRGMNNEVTKKQSG